MTPHAGLRVSLGQHSRAGRCGVNQDFHGAVVPAEPLLSTKGVAVALADGIGSSSVSQVASAAAVHGFLDDYYATSEAWSVRRSAQRVLAATNSWLHAQTMRSAARFDRDRGYVCTFSALVVKGRDVHLLHVGDARVWRLHPLALEQLTEDHRVRLSSAESFLGRALGAGPHVEIDYRRWAAEPGEVYVLATDGAYAHLEPAMVHAALERCSGDLDAAAAALVGAAAARGSTDDATIQLVRIDALPDADVSRLHAERCRLALPPSLAPRMRFESYTIVRELHASARSHVHLALDEDSGRHVVLKTPSVDLRDDAGYLDRFLLEAWVARRIDNAHVLRPCDSGRPRRHLYVAMEYVEGRTLKQWMIDHPRPDLDRVRAIVAQLAKALQAFHGKEMLHRDLRPDNVLIDRSGTVKLIDFASAHVAGLAEGTFDIDRRAVAGTLQYTAPEVLTGAGADARSDLFALAAVAYEMLTGSLPYGLQAARVRTPVDAKRLRCVPLRHLRPDMPAWVDAVLQKALHPDPAKRHEAVSEFAHALHVPPRFEQRREAPPLIERNPVVFWQVTALVLAGVAVVLLGLLVRAPQ